MAYRKFDQIRIAGVAAAVPAQIRKNSDILGDANDIGKTANMVGIESRHVTPKDVCASDLCFAAAENLLGDIGWEKDTVDALIFLSQTPDYVVPATSCVLQSRLNLSTKCAAFDMNLGCSGYIYGLLTAFGLIDKSSIKRILLLVGDTPSKLTSPHDVAANILFGDAGTATAIEFDAEAGESFISVGTDGTASESLMIHAGGFRHPKSVESSIRKPHPKDQVLRSEEELYTPRH